MSIQIETFPVYPLGCNCSIVYCDSTMETILIDPGGNEDEIISYLKEKNLVLKEIIHTHAHFDHCLGTKKISDSVSKCKIGLHKEDLPLYTNLEMQCRKFGMSFSGITNPIDHFLQDNELLNFGENFKFEIIHTPGHTPGSICFSITTEKSPILFSGDTLFAGSIGRTDLWGGDSEKIISSIKNRIFNLEDSTVVIPGHGEFTNIFNEKKYNPFF